MYIYFFKIIRDYILWEVCRTRRRRRRFWTSHRASTEMLNQFYPGFKDSDISRHGIARAERDGTRAETRFRLSPKRTSPFKSVGESVQSTTGSRAVRISSRRIVILDRPRSEVKWNCTGYPLHSPVSSSLPFPCVTVCHQVTN